MAICKLTLGSLFNGIGGWILAGEKYGIKTLWESEIDEYCQAVTHHHFPDVKQLGDITKIKVEDLPPVDIICAGSPCQDLSVAGKRAGLEGERSGLFHTAIRLVHELRARTGKPRYFVWENVPGAFSSNKGLDFRAVLEEISETEIPMPKDNKWAPAGVVEWDGGSICWRTLDAQYWGVPQRRKRIFLVADFGEQSAGEILFERKSLYGDTSECERKGQDLATDAGTGTNCTGWDAYQHHNWRESEQFGTLTSESTNHVRGDTPLVSSKACTLSMRSGKPGGGKDPLVKEELSLALSTQNTQTVFTGGFKYRNGAKARSIGYADEQAPTLETSQNVAIYNTPIVQCLNDQGGSVMDVSDKAATLRAQSHGHEPIVHTIGGDKIPKGYCCSMGHDQRASTYPCEIADSLMASDYKQPPIANDTAKTVRKLTPTECERLQGLPDGYTNIEFNGKPAPDSRRYKALGNGMAQPCADYVIQRIKEAKEHE
jgi:DNA (cytosine-5)-methyltransferase 1